MFNVGAGELIFILVAALIVLGPQRLPEFARAIGKFMREFRRQTDEVRTVVEREFYKMDQEFIDEPRPPVPMGTPAVLPSPVPVAPPAPSVALQAAATVVEPPQPGASTQSVQPAAVPTAGSGTLAGAESPALARLEPVPGTVAQDVSKNG